MKLNFVKSSIPVCLIDNLTKFIEPELAIVANSHSITFNRYF